MIKMPTYFKYIYRKQLFYYRKYRLIQRNIDSFIEKKYTIQKQVIPIWVVPIFYDLINGDFQEGNRT